MPTLRHTEQASGTHTTRHTEQASVASLSKYLKRKCNSNAVTDKERQGILRLLRKLQNDRWDKLQDDKEKTNGL